MYENPYVMDPALAKDTRHLRQSEHQARALAGQGLGAQQDALGMYRDAAMGNGPSVAEAQMLVGADQSIANQTAMAAMGRSGNLGSIQRQAGQSAVATNLATNQQLGALRAQEQQAAMAGYAGMGTQMQNQALQEQLAYAGLGAEAQLQAQQLGTQYDLERRQQKIQQQANNRQFGLGVSQQVLGAVGTGLGAAGIVSDRLLKTNVRPSGGAASETFAALDPSAFEYVEGAGPPGDRVGVMAQDLARTPAGAAVVVPTEDGLAVDTGQLEALNAAGLAEHEQRMRRLEEMLAMQSPTQPTVGGPVQGVPISQPQMLAGSSFKPMATAGALRGAA